MLVLLLSHLVAAALAPLLVRWWGRQAFLALALVPAAGFGWLLTRLATVTGGGESRWSQHASLALLYPAAGADPLSRERRCGAVLFPGRKR